jgi:sulfide:quinone oxidoreductase
MAHIAIIGAGVGGMPAAYELRSLLSKEHRITVVSAVDYFQFTPSNPWVAVGWRDRDCITLKIKPLLERKGIEFISKPVSKIEAENNILILSGGTPEEQALVYRNMRPRERRVVQHL